MGGERRESFRLGCSSKLPAGNPDMLGSQIQEHRPLWDASYAWGLGILEAFVSSP